MFTQIKNGKRRCEAPDIYTPSWDYLREVLSDSGFSVEQRASSKEYIMKGCHGLILIYVKFNNETQCKVLCISDGGSNESLDLDWGDRSKSSQNGDLVLKVIRETWFSSPKLSV
jgi:hypothetical protein